MDFNKIVSIFESILFVSSESISQKDFFAILNEFGLNISKNDFKRVVFLLEEKYKSEDSGLKLLITGDSYKLVSNPINNSYVELITSIKKKKTLSQAALEVISIIAYKQPITKAEVDELRGVNSDGVLNNLISLNIIEEKGRLDRIGRPILYGTTDLFLREFGIKSLKDLPKIDNIESD